MTTRPFLFGLCALSLSLAACQVAEPEYIPLTPIFIPYDDPLDKYDRPEEKFDRALE